MVNNEINDLSLMVMDLDTPDATLLRDVAPGLDMSKTDARTLYAVTKLMELYEEKLSTSGTSKWFVPGTPYGIEHCPKHKLFFEAGKNYYERVFAASNRTGKSLSGAFETACHATGLYPFWWNGRVFDRPTKIWACGADAKSTRDTAQKELLGPIGSWGTGMIPAELLGKCSMLAGVPQGVDFIEVKHVSGGKSVIAFKNYAQDIKAFYGTAMDVIWLDEECPENIYNECLIRTMTTEGIVFVTFTPLHGLTPLVVKFYAKADLLGGARGLDGVSNENVTDGTEEQEARLVNRKVAKAIINAGWDDAPWLTEDSKRRMLDDTLPHLREARSKGIPAMGSGSIYPIPLADITVEPFAIPDYYERMYALDVGWNKTAVLWMARNPDTDVIYIYDEHYQGESPPAVHAEAIKSRGSWIPGVIDPASRGRSQVDGMRLMTIYKEMLRDLYPAKNEVDAGISNTYNRLASGKIKVFSTLRHFAKEYILYRRDLQGKIVKENDHLMDDLRYLVNNYVRAVSRIDSTSSGLGGTYSGTKRYDI